jgi:hypothetical protein
MTVMEPHDSVDELLHRAEMAMYYDKRRNMPDRYRPPWRGELR